MIVKRKAVYDGVLAIPAGERGSYSVRHVDEPAGRTFHLNTFRTALMGGHAAGSVVYDRPTRWHQLVGPTGVWMSDLPIEQAQHDRALAAVRRGRVLVGGLGLGYAVTVLALRPEIQEVVAVEVAQEVIDLVAPYLLVEDAAARRKLRVVRADLFDYLSGLPTGQFSHAFYDIWQSDGEHTFFKTVVPLLQLSRRRVRSAVICWNESVMRGQLYLSLCGRRDAVAAPHQAAPSIDALCEDGGSFWIAWSAPFFRWVRANPGSAQFDEMAGLYAAGYGRPTFPDTWRLVAGQDIQDLDTTQ